MTTTTTYTIGDKTDFLFFSRRISNDNFRATAEGEDEQVTTNGIDGQVYNGIPDWVGENLYIIISVAKPLNDQGE